MVQLNYLVSLPGRTNKDPFSLISGLCHLDFWRSAHGSSDYLIHSGRLMGPVMTENLKVPTAMARLKGLDSVTEHLDCRDRCQTNLISSG